MKYGYIYNAMVNSYWAMLPAKFAQMAELISAKALEIEGSIPLTISFGTEEDEAMEARNERHAASAERIEAYAIEIDPNAGPARANQPTKGGLIQVIPIEGILAPRASQMDASDVSTSIRGLQKQFRAALNDPRVSDIVFDIDSPGGSVAGIQEFADEVFSSRKQGTRITAVANHLAASAAFWIGTAADEFVASPGSDVGSIGVLAIHKDESEAQAAKGVKTTIVSAGEFKAEGNPIEPLSDDARGALQARVDEHFSDFVSGVARNRGTSQKRVLSDFGQGRIVSARNALEAKMVDRIATLDQTVSTIATARRRRAQGAARLGAARLSVARSGAGLA